MTTLSHELLGNGAAQSRAAPWVMRMSNKFKLTIIAAIIIVALACLGVVVGLSYAPNSPGNNITMVVGFCSTIVVSLFTLLRAEKTAGEVRETHRDLQHAKGDIEKTQEFVREAKEEIKNHAEEVRQKFSPQSEIVRIAVEAERDQLLNRTSMPKSRQELHEIIEEVVTLTFTKLNKELVEQLKEIKQRLDREPT